MIRFLVLGIAVVAAYLIVKGILQLIKSRQCSSCQGMGYWQGTRGEKNHCKACDGSGVAT